MRKATSLIQFILIIIVAVLLLTQAIKSPYGIILATFVLLVAAAASALSFRVREKGYVDKIIKLTRELNVASSRITSVSQEIGITISENNDSSQALFQETKDMRTLTADVTTSIGSMINAIKSMIANADEARTTAQTMETTSRSSFDTINSSVDEIMSIVDTMSDIKITSGKAADSLDRLRETSESVMTIVRQISDISKQMHIIAVNASVEAVRAGNSGSSFAVVAKEFQSLSAMTDHAVSSISNLLDSIQLNILEAYHVVKENDGRVENGVRNSKNVEQNLSVIRQLFSEIVTMIHRISSISDIESQLADDMGTHLDQIEALIAETSDNVARVYESALSQRKGNENISEMGLKLKSASNELIALTDGSIVQETETLDQKNADKCAAFFPILRDALCRVPDIISKDPARHQALLSRFKSQYPIMEAVWTNDANGRFICSIPKAGIANAAVRDWFQSAMKGTAFTSAIYISGITKNRCVTLSLPFHNAQNDIIGVVGVDINLDMLRGKPLH